MFELGLLERLKNSKHVATANKENVSFTAYIRVLLSNEHSYEIYWLEAFLKLLKFNMSFFLSLFPKTNLHNFYWFQWISWNSLKLFLCRKICWSCFYQKDDKINRNIYMSWMMASKQNNLMLKGMQNFK